MTTPALHEDHPPERFAPACSACQADAEAAFLEAVARAPEPACVGCGCTTSRPCPGGCAWVSRAPTVCSACVPEEFLEAPL